MPFTVQVRNFGKLADATVRVAPLTVLAGPNNTGKTFFSKGLYSFFDAMNANLFHEMVDADVSPLLNDLAALGAWVRDKGMLDSLPHFEAAMDGAISMAEIAASISLESEVDDGGPHPALQEATEKLKTVFAEFSPEVSDLIRKADTTMPFFYGGEFPSQMRGNFERLVRTGEMSRYALAASGLLRRARTVFSNNFQVPDLSVLRGPEEEQDAMIDIIGVGGLCLDSHGGMTPKVSFSGLHQLRRMFSRAVYLDSPALWKLKPTLERAGRRPGIRRARLELLGVPGYFNNLADDLRKQYLGDMVASDEIRRLSTKVVRGKVVPNDNTGELLYAEAGAPVSRPLPVVSTGVANLGFLAMLVERKIVGKDVFLFIDEPEAHLHPAWQVEMIRLLFALARDGVNVVIATHSADILERLNGLVKRDPELAELVALNHFSGDGVNEGGDKQFRDRMGDILADLTEAFSDSYMMNQGAS